MARPPKFSVETILDGAGAAVLEHWREATIAHVSEFTGAPVGSIYHRFGSRDELFAALWVRAINRFHEALLAACDHPDPQVALERAAVCIPRFCRDHPADAKVMTLYRLQDLLALELSMHDELATINDKVYARLRELVAQRWGEVTERRLTLVGLACQLGPYGLIRPWIGGDIPPEVDEAVLASARGVLALGD
ncbi:TetR/AcrR family transcriptional regulator [Mariniluteicoccus endophyticus]